MATVLRCDLCDLSFGSIQEMFDHKLSLLHHTKLQEKGVKSHYCQVCSTHSYTLESFIEHVNSESHQQRLQQSHASASSGLDQSEQQQLYAVEDSQKTKRKSHSLDNNPSSAPQSATKRFRSVQTQAVQQHSAAHSFNNHPSHSSQPPPMSHARRPSPRFPLHSQLPPPHSQSPHYLHPSVQRFSHNPPTRFPHPPMQSLHPPAQFPRPTQSPRPPTQSPRPPTQSPRPPTQSLRPPPTQSPPPPMQPPRPPMQSPRPPPTQSPPPPTQSPRPPTQSPRPPPTQSPRPPTQSSRPHVKQSSRPAAAQSQPPLTRSSLPNSSISPSHYTVPPHSAAVLASSASQPNLHVLVTDVVAGLRQKINSTPPPPFRSHQYHGPAGRGRGRGASNVNRDMEAEMFGLQVKEKVLKHAVDQVVRRCDEEAMKQKLQSFARMGQQCKKNYQNKRGGIVPGTEKLVPPMKNKSAKAKPSNSKAQSSNTSDDTTSTTAVVFSSGVPVPSCSAHSTTVSTTSSFVSSVNSSKAPVVSSSLASNSTPVASVTSISTSVTSSSVTCTSASIPATSALVVSDSAPFTSSSVTSPSTPVSLKESSEAICTSALVTGSVSLEEPSVTRSSASHSNKFGSTDSGVLDDTSHQLDSLSSFSETQPNVKDIVTSVPVTTVTTKSSTSTAPVSSRKRKSSSSGNNPTKVTKLSQSVTTATVTTGTITAATPTVADISIPLSGTQYALPCQVTVSGSSNPSHSRQPLLIPLVGVPQLTNSSMYKSTQNNGSGIPKDSTAGFSGGKGELFSTSELVQKIIEGAKPLENITLGTSSDSVSLQSAAPSSGDTGQLDTAAHNIDGSESASVAVTEKGEVMKSDKVPSPEAMSPRILCCFKQKDGQECNKPVVDGYRLCDKHLQAANVIKQNLKLSPSKSPTTNTVPTTQLPATATNSVGSTPTSEREATPVISSPSTPVSCGNQLKSSLTTLNKREEQMQSSLMQAESQLNEIVERRTKMDSLEVNLDAKIQSVKESLRTATVKYHELRDSTNAVFNTLKDSSDASESTAVIKLLSELERLHKEEGLAVADLKRLTQEDVSLSDGKKALQDTQVQLQAKEAHLMSQCKEYASEYQQILSQKQTILFNKYIPTIKRPKSPTAPASSVSSPTTTSAPQTAEMEVDPSEDASNEPVQADLRTNTVLQEPEAAPSTSHQIESSQHVSELLVQAPLDNMDSTVAAVLQAGIKQEEEEVDVETPAVPVVSKGQCHEVSSSNQLQTQQSVEVLGETVLFESNGGAVLTMVIYGNELFTCSSDKSIYSYCIKTGKRIKNFSNHQKSVTCLELYSGTDGKTYLLSSSDRFVHMQNIKTAKVVTKFRCGARVMHLTLCRHLLYIGQSSGVIAIMNLEKMICIGKQPCHPMDVSISCIKASPTHLFTAAFDYTVACWDVSAIIPTEKLKTDLKRLHLFNSFTNTVLCILVHDNLLYCGSADKTLQVFNIQTWDRVQYLTCHNGAVSNVKIVGKLLVTTCFDKLVRCFDLERLTLLQLYGGHTDLIYSLATHREMIYTGCRDGAINVFKIDLTVFYECKWVNCNLRFGLLVHLRDHLKDHCPASESPSTLHACRWINCSLKVNLLLKHLQTHLPSINQ